MLAHGICNAHTHVSSTLAAYSAVRRSRSTARQPASEPTNQPARWMQTSAPAAKGGRASLRLLRVVIMIDPGVDVGGALGAEFERARRIPASGIGRSAARAGWSDRLPRCCAVR